MSLHWTLFCDSYPLFFRHHIFSELQSSNVTIHRQGKVHALCISFFKKLGSFRKTQAVHMPGVKALIEEEETLWDVDNAVPMAEEVKLWLPSQVPEDEHLFISEPAPYYAEFQLQEGECLDTLASI